MPRAPKQAKNNADFDDDRSSDGSDDGKDLEGFIVEDEIDDEEENHSKPSAPEDESNEVAEVLKDAEKLTQGISSTVVGGRTLRNRETLKKPEPYFDVEMYQKLTQADEVREKIQMLKTWASSGEYVCPILKSLTKKTDPQIVEDEYRKAKAALEIPDTDDEDDDEEEEEEDSEDMEVEEDESDDDEEEEDDDEEDMDDDEEEEEED